MKQKEIWRDVVGYEDWYKISNLGRVWHKKNKYYVSISSPKGSYKMLRLTTDEGSKVKRLHRLLAKAFIPNPNNKECINHKDGNKLNNDLSNLEWISRGDNIRHAFDIGLVDNSGENSHNSKLKDDIVLEMRNAYNLGCFSFAELGSAYGVTRSVAWKAVSGHTWSHI